MWRLGRGAGVVKRYPTFLTRRGRPLRGTLYGVPWRPRRLLEDQDGAVDAIVAGVDALARRGAAAVGLGALCAVVGSRGRAVSERSPVPVTTGHELTAWAAARTANRVTQLVGRDPREPVAVLGAPWGVAVAAAELLARRGRRVMLAARSRGSALARIAARTPDVELVEPDEALARARFVVCASSGGGRLTEAALCPGTVVIDVARPRDLVGLRARPDVLTVDGETLALPAGAHLGGVTVVYNWLVGQGPANVFACFAAPMLAAMGDIPEPISQDRFLDPEAVEAWGAVAEGHGFHVDSLYDRGRAVEPDVLRRWGRRYPSK